MPEELPYLLTADPAFALRSLRPGHLAEVFPSIDHAGLMSAYTLWGDLPRYWELAEPLANDLEAAVDALIPPPSGTPHGEAVWLLREATPLATALQPMLDYWKCRRTG